LFGSRSLGKPEHIGLIRDLRERDWLWLGKVLTPLAHSPCGKLFCGLEILMVFWSVVYL